MMGSPNIVDVSEATFQVEVIERSYEQPVVVDFWAPWCGPCRMLGPVLEKLANEGNGSFRLAKVNSDENQSIAVDYNIRGIPAVKAFRDGKVVAEFVGAQPEPKVREFLKQIAPQPGDAAAAEAARLLSERRWAEAEATYRKNGAPRPSLGLAKALLGQGKASEAEAVLQGVEDHGELAGAEALRPLAGFLSHPTDGADGRDDLDALLRQSAETLVLGDYPAAMDALLDVMRKDRRYRGDTPRKVMLGLFELLGEQDPLTREYRNKLASVLF
jgi:putative thioredoxin